MWSRRAAVLAMICSSIGCTQTPEARPKPKPALGSVQPDPLFSATQLQIRDDKLYMHFVHARIEAPEFPLATLGPEDRLEADELELIAQWAAQRPDPERPITAHADRDIEDETIRALAEALGEDPETFVVWVPRTWKCGTL